MTLPERVEHVSDQYVAPMAVPIDRVIESWNGLPVVELHEYEAVRAAFFNKDLSRAFDKRPFEAGNPGDGTVSTVHGDLHRARRRIENTQFRTERLTEYERDLYPPILSDLLDRLLVGPSADMAPIAPYLSIVLAARRAGLDVDHHDLAPLTQLIALVDAFSQGLGPGILEMPDPDQARRRVLQAVAEFEADFVKPAVDRRQRLLARIAHGEDEALPTDVLTVLLQHRDEPELALDDGRITREVATYLQGGTHSSAQTLLNVLYFMLPIFERDEGVRDRVVKDQVFAARCVHETVRLRVITPNAKRLAEQDTEVAGVPVPKGSMVILDVAAANRSRAHYGPDADTFDPDRALEETVPRWGLSFGLGAHGCPGRSSAVGLPIAPDFSPREDHLFGLVTLMVQQVVSRGVARDPERSPVPDTRSYKTNFWREFPVVLP